MARQARLVFDELDFIYSPSKDPAADRDYFVDVLGAREVFAIQSGDERLAAVVLSDKPLLLFAGHLEGRQPFLVYRVCDFDDAVRALESGGWQREESFEIPHGPCCTFETPGGHRIGFYQLTRPEVGAQFEGRKDF